jgi:Fe-S cluster biogenesis protein NfuA
MESEIKITGMPASGEPERCSFVVSRPLFADRSFFFPNAEKAKGSPLVERLFAIPGIESVLVAHDTVTVVKSTPEPWPAIGKQIGAIIRETLATDAPPVAVDVLRDIPPEAVLREVIQQLIDTEINPALGSHGGFVELIDVKENSLFMRMGGGCQGCGMANATLRGGIERRIREIIPAVGEILDVTDHASGRNPYYGHA